MAIADGEFHAPSERLILTGSLLHSGGTFHANGGKLLLNHTEPHTLAVPTVHDLVINDGLVGYWRFDEGGGEVAADASGYDHHGRLVNAPQWSDDVPPTNFQNSGSLAFNSQTSDYVAINDHERLNLHTDFTLSAWVRRTNPGSAGVIYASGSQPNFWFVGFRSNDRLAFTVRGVADYDAATPITDSEWHHIAVVKRGDHGENLRIYLDGELDGVFAVGSLNLPQGEKRIGVWTDAAPTPRFGGQIDEVRLYNRALSPADVAALAAGSHPDLIIPPDLLGYWPLDEGAGGTLQDAAGHNPDAVLVNGGAWTTSTPQSRFHNPHALSLNGSQYANLGAGAAVGALTNDFSVAAWIRPDQLSGIQRILSSARTGSNAGWGFATNGSRLRFTTFGVKDYDMSTGQLPADAWVHVAAVMDANNDVTFYINGQAVQTISGSSPANVNPNNPFLIGATTRVGSTTTIERFTGHLDDLRVYNRPLSAAEIARLAQGYHPHGGTTGLAAALHVTGDLVLNSGVLDVHPEENHTITLNGDFRRHGGHFSGQSGNLIIDGSGASAADARGATSERMQYVDVDAITLHDFTVTAGTGVIAIGEVTLTGMCINQGFLRESKVVRGPGPIDFYLAVLQIDVTKPGGLTHLTVDGYGHRHHPEAPPDLQTGNYWTLTPNEGADGYSVNLMAKAEFPPDHHTSLCRYDGQTWDCGPSAFDPVMMTVTRLGITELTGDWAVSRSGGESQRLFLPVVSFHD